MNRLIVFAIAALALGAPASADDACKIAVIDMYRVSEGYERYLASRKILEARKAELQDVVDEEEKSVLALIEELEVLRATATQQELARKRSEIEGRDRELREFVGTSNAQFRDDLDSLQFRTKNEIETVVQSIAVARAYSIVLEKNMALFASDALDITSEVITELNKRFRPLAAGPGSSLRPRAATPQTSPTALPSPTTPGRGWPFRDDR